MRSSLTAAHGLRDHPLGFDFSRPTYTDNCGLPYPLWCSKGGDLYSLYRADFPFLAFLNC
jgi:hypothetical protein